MTRESMGLAFRYSVDLARTQDELAVMTARCATMTQLVTAAAEDLSNCRITIDGKTKRIMETRVMRAASTLCEALMIAGIELPAKPEDGAQLIEASQIGGDQAS